MQLMTQARIWDLPSVVRGRTSDGKVLHQGTGRMVMSTLQPPEGASRSKTDQLLLVSLEHFYQLLHLYLLM